MLNPFTFFIKNKHNTIMLVSILLISTFCISFITTLINSVNITSEEATVSPFKNFSVVTYLGDDANKGKNEINTIQSVSFYYETVLSTIPINTVFGTTSSYIFFLDDKTEILNTINNCNLNLDSDLVSSMNEDEIFMHIDLLKNKELNIGDQLGNYKIIGTFSGETKFSIGYINRNEIINNTINDTSYLLFPKNNDLINLNNSLEKLDDKKWNVLSYQKALSYLDDEFATINLILLIVIIMVSMCLSIAVAALVYAIYSNRYNEFAILNAIGYKKSKIKVMLFSEILLVATISWVLGYLLSLIVLSIINVLIYSDMGQSMAIISVEGMLYTLIIPVLVTISAVFPAISKLSKTDLISIIERR